jgi:polyisoprenoid-binding protein YceI
MLVLSLLPVAPAAGERDWRVDAARSSIAFDYVVNDVAATGAFRRVEGEGSFDPARPEATRLELRIDPTALDLGDPLATGFAQSAEWFDTANHPTVRYRLTRLTPLPDGRWLALGDIAIKGRLRVLETPLSLALGDAEAQARGTISFDRRDFELGTGLSQLFVTVGPDVSVAFDLIATPETAP